MHETLLAIDPSYRGTGLCLLDTLSSTIRVQIIRGPEETRKDKDFGGLYMAALDLANDLQDWLIRVNLYPTVVMSEVPPPVGQYAAGLFLLDGMLLNRITRLPRPPRAILTMNPSWLAYLFSARKIPRRTLTELGESLLAAFRLAGFAVETRRKRLCNDEGVAVALAARAWCRVHPEGNLTREIVRACPRIFAEKEKTMWGVV